MSTPEDLEVPFVLIGIAYSAVFLFAVSAAAHVWSGMHSLALAGLLFVGTPTLLVQGARLWRRRQASAQHRAAFLLSVGFPAALAALIGFAVLVGG